MVNDRIDELEEFYDENRNDLTWYGADENPDKLLEYKDRMKEVVEEISEEYGVETGDYAGRAGEMLASRVQEELEVPMGNPGDGNKSPNFDKARALLGE